MAGGKCRLPSFGWVECTRDEEVCSRVVTKDWVAEDEEPCPECPECPECPDPFDAGELRNRLNDFRQQLYNFRDQLRTKYGR